MSNEQELVNGLEEVVLGEDGQPLSKKALKKLQKKQEKEAKKEKQRLAEIQAQERPVEIVADYESAKYGDLKLIQSGSESGRSWTSVEKLTPEIAGINVWVRARLHTVRAKGKVAFLVLRQCSSTVQVMLISDDSIPREMVKYVSKIPCESIIDVYGSVSLTPSDITSVSQQKVEIIAAKVFVVSCASSVLPIQIADASRPLAEDLDAPQDESSGPTVGRDVRLNNRWIDLRTTANHAIFRIQSAVGRYFRQYFIDRDFIEVHTPKIISAASEGGADVFQLGYFGKPAFLAQSPQLYKQICINADMKRVFEIGPVFRSENSNTHRHLCEFVGLDFEMEIQEHYHEVLKALGGVFKYIFDNLEANHSTELEAIRAQYPFEPLQYPDEPLVLHFVDAIKLLQESGDTEADPLTDITTPQEKALGKLVKEKYGTDFYMVDRYPMSARPFYTMPCPDDPNFSNSYDVFLRGEEITSGAQRIHDHSMLVERALAQDPPIDLSTISSYIDSFKYGSSPHGGAGIGLERVVMLYCGLKNIRLSSLFPRDPKRVVP